MVRCVEAIETILNMIHVTHAAMRILPWAEEELSSLRQLSPQKVRYILSEQINEQRILCKSLLELDFGEFFHVLRDKLWSLVCRYSDAA